MITSTPNVYDTLIIGGGPGGLTAAIYLRRFTRNIVVIDNGGGIGIGVNWFFSSRVSLETKMAALARGVPQDIKYDTPFDTTKFVSESINEVYKTLIEADELHYLLGAQNCHSPSMSR